jgi:hypothetical protein
MVLGNNERNAAPVECVKSDETGEIDARGCKWEESFGLDLVLTGIGGS